MSQLGLMNYIANQGTVSAGALLPPSTTQWNLSLWPLSGVPDQTMSVVWKQAVPGAEFAHRVTTTTQAAEYGPSIVLRVLCHVLVNCLPEEGLPELHENLIDLHDFYSKRAIHLLSPAPVQKSVSVNIKRVLTSQPFDVSED
ncbi:MAG TPA: hypothetical protein VFA89_11480 [Terriglobales bacterium]|nr:hypothetical protein [Terriglobales bacterium]